MDPWRECKRIVDEHFVDRALLRSFNIEILEEILTEGIKQPVEKRQEEKQDYLVSHKGWSIKATVTKCTLTLWTIYRD